MIKIRNQNGEVIQIPGIKGKDGKSAYDYAVEAGYDGSEQDFINHLVSVSTPITGNTAIPDWNQNDETASDYIKNRTHWVEGEDTNNMVTTCLPETEVPYISPESLEDIPDGVNLYGFENEEDVPIISSLVAGSEYTVTINGTEYNTVYSNLGNSQYLGNFVKYLALANSITIEEAETLIANEGLNVTSNGEPFFMMLQNNHIYEIITFDELYTTSTDNATIGITKVGPAIYLGETEIPNYENEQFAAAGINSYQYEDEATGPTVSGLTLGRKYAVTINGNEYSTIYDNSSEILFGDGYTYLGDIIKMYSLTQNIDINLIEEEIAAQGYSATSNGEPFVIIMNNGAIMYACVWDELYVADSTDPLTINSIADAINITYHKLDAGFIPDTIATKNDVDSAIEAAITAAINASY